ncbi:MAG: M48 family metalloprotease [Bdellovibrionales bacterium]
MTEPLGLSTYRWNNNLKSILILALFPCLLVGLVWLFFFLVGMMQETPQGYVPARTAYAYGIKTLLPQGLPLMEFARAGTQNLLPFVLAIAAGWVVIGGLFNQSLIQGSTGAHPIERSQSPKIYNLLENLCISRGMKTPKLYLIQTPVMNAYASGLSEASYAVTVTSGLVEALSQDELEAVLAHELTHIRNRDVRLLVVTILFGGMLSFFAEMFFRSARFSGSSSSNDRRKGSGAILILAAILLLIGYFIATLLRLALSRRREYLADAGAVELTKRPESLIHALQKISGHAAMPKAPSGVQAMLIENPPSFFGLFDTHPPIESRIAVLRRLGNLPRQSASIIPNTR